MAYFIRDSLSLYIVSSSNVPERENQTFVCMAVWAMFVYCFCYAFSGPNLAVASSKMLMRAKLDASEELTSTTGCRGRDADLLVLGQAPHH